MRKTINNVRTELESIVNSHYQLNGFYYGDIATSLNSLDGKVYPAIYCNITAGSMDDFYTNLTIDLYACDKVEDDNRELFDVESDTIQYLRDLYEVIKNSQRWKSFSKVSSPTTVTRKYEDRLQDLTTGWGFSISVGIKSDSGVCGLPIDGYPSGGETCSPVTVLLNGEFYASVPSGGTIDIPCGDIQYFDLELGEIIMRDDLEVGDTVTIGGILMRNVV